MGKTKKEDVLKIEVPRVAIAMFFGIFLGLLFTSIFYELEDYKQSVEQDSFRVSYKACTYVIQGNDFMYVRVHCDRADPDAQGTVIYFSDMCKQMGGRLVSDTGCFLDLKVSE